MTISKVDISLRSLPTLKNQVGDESKQKTGSYYSLNLDTISMYEFPFVLLGFFPSKDDIYKIQTSLTDALTHSSLCLEYNKTYEHETSHSCSFYALDVQ